MLSRVSDGPRWGNKQARSTPNTDNIGMLSYIVPPNVGCTPVIVPVNQHLPSRLMHSHQATPGPRFAIDYGTTLTGGSNTERQLTRSGSFTVSATGSNCSLFF